MAFAPYHNSNRTATQGELLGSFNHADTDCLFEYADRVPGDNPAIGEESPHVIYVGPLQERRWGLVLKTRVYIIVDETDDGFVTEKWLIKKHRIYKK